MGGTSKSGQRSQAPSYGAKKSTGKGGKSGQQMQSPTYGAQAQPNAGKSGKGNLAFQPPVYNPLSQGMQTQQPGQSRWQDYATMTGGTKPAQPAQPATPAQPASPTTGAPPTPEPVAPQQGGMWAVPQAADRGRFGVDWSKVSPEDINSYMSGSYGQMKVAPNLTNKFAATPEFYNAVNSTLGFKEMATPGQYDKGWNTIGGANAEKQAEPWVQKMTEVLGRPLTQPERMQLAQRAAGWGFRQVGQDYENSNNPNWTKGGQQAPGLAPSFGYEPR